MTMFIDPHTHMVSRTTDDYEAMAAAGVVAVIEPAFWIGQPRTHVGTYIDYLSTIVGWERAELTPGKPKAHFSFRRGIIGPLSPPRSTG